DRQRPSVDAVSGVLPPKVARMLINIGNDTKKDSITFLDPFCGSGTILMEALLLGYDSVGFDISVKAIEDSTKNLNWLKQKYPVTTPVSLYQADSSEVKPKDLGLKPVDLIVTEGYLGPSTFDQSQLSVIIKELKELYIKVLPN